MCSDKGYTREQVGAVGSCGASGIKPGVTSRKDGRVPLGPCTANMEPRMQPRGGKREAAKGRSLAIDVWSASRRCSIRLRGLVVGEVCSS